MSACALAAPPQDCYTLPMEYRRCGRSGVLLPEISLGLWHNFGAGDNPEACRDILRRALELGICHWDLADNYGPPPGAAEETLGRLLQQDDILRHHRDELFLSTKAGHLMWPGPYGDWASRKHLLAGLNQSLRRLRLEYVDVFYSHRPDPNTPLEETIGALVQAVRSGKALYVGLSKYPPALFNRACALLEEENIPCLIHQYRYNMLDRSAEAAVIPATQERKVGSIVFSPLAQGVLTGKYLGGNCPADARALRADSPFLDMEKAQADAARVEKLAAIAQEAGMPLTQLALRYVLRRPEITSVLIGARNVQQLETAAEAAGQAALDADTLRAIEAALA